MGPSEGELGRDLNISLGQHYKSPAVEQCIKEVGPSMCKDGGDLDVSLGLFCGPLTFDEVCK